MGESNRYIGNVDEMIATQSPIEALRQFGVDVPDKSSGELRIPCVFDSRCQSSSYGNLTINLNEPQNPIYCHTCGTRGNLLTLLHGLKEHRPPTGGKLRGDEFKAAVRTLRELAAGKIMAIVDSAPSAGPNPAPPTQAKPVATVTRNVPIKDSENENARKLVNLFEQFVTDPAQMSPRAAAYFRRRPWLTPAVATEWKMGYLPTSAKSLLRGWITYAYQDEQDEIITYFGRDPGFEEKQAEAKRTGSTELPLKHRFVKGFARGLDLYGEHAGRLADRRLRESLGKIGLVVVEGPNDTIRLSTLGIAAVGLCSNRATDEQVAKIARFARQAGQGRVIILGDNDAEGEAGARDLLWRLNQVAGVTVRLGWSRSTHAGAFDGRQPESLTEAEARAILVP